MRTPEQSALLIAVLLHRSGERRARLSVKTLKLISRRVHLRGAFVSSVVEILLRDMGICMTELGSGGYGLMYAKALEAARGITAKKHLDGLHHQDLTSEDEKKLWKEVLPQSDDTEDEGENE